MTTLTSSLIVKLIDGISAPAKKAAESLKGIGRQAAALNGQRLASAGERLAAASAANAAKLDAMRGRMVEAAAVGYGLARALEAPLAKAREFETILLDIAQKGDMSDEAMKRLGASIGELAGKLRKSVDQATLAKGVDILAGFGLDNQTALKLMEPISRAAVAYRAEVEDLAKASFAAMDNMKVPAAEMAKALDVMAQSGKEGAFELKDMAREFPVLTAAAQALGMTGVNSVAKLSAALQIARKGAATGSEAATNTANLMQKIVSPETTKKFAKVGIDIRKELKKVQKEGGDVFEMIANLVTKATKGDLSKIGDFFQDAEVQKFLRPLIQNLEEYKRIRNKAGGASGVVDADFERRLKTGDAALAQFKNRLSDLARTIGSIVLPVANDLMAVIGPLVDMLASAAERFPGATKAVLLSAAALVGLKVAATAAVFAFTYLRGAVLLLQVAMLRLQKALFALLAAAFAPLRAALIALAGTLQIVALRFRLAAAAGLLFSRALVAGTIATFARALFGLLRPLALVAVAMRVLRVATIATGWGALLVGLAAAGTKIYNNWQNIVAGFRAFRGAFMREIRPILNDPAVAGFAAILKRIGEAWEGMTSVGRTADFQAFGQKMAKDLADALKALLEFKNALAGWVPALPKIDIGSLFEVAPGGDWIGTLATKAREALASFGQTIAAECTRIAGEARGLVAQIGTAIVDGFSGVGEQLRAAGASAMQALWDGLKSVGESIVGWASGLAARIVAPFTGALNRLRGAPTGGGAPASTPAPASPPARAQGGRVNAGQVYQVNDGGGNDPVELFRPNKSGTINTAEQKRQAERKAAAGGQAAAGGGPITVNATFNLSAGAIPDPRALARDVVRHVEGEIRKSRRGLFSDSDLRTV